MKMLVGHDEDVGRQELWTLDQSTFSIFLSASQFEREDSKFNDNKRNKIA